MLILKAAYGYGLGMKQMKKNQKNDANWPVPQIDSSRCDGCNLCVLACPNHALALENNVAVVAHPDRCDYSGLCEQVCPKSAIQRRFEIIYPELPGSNTNKKGD